MPHVLYARADMWALLGVWAVQQTIDNSNDQCEDCGSVPDARVPYTYGRQVGFCLGGDSNQCYDCYYTQDCATAPYSTRKVNLPSAMLNNTGVMDYFKQEFGFSPLEVGNQGACIVTKSACPGHRHHGRPHPGRCQHLQLRVARGVGHRPGGLT